MEHSQVSQDQKSDRLSCPVVWLLIASAALVVALQCGRLVVAWKTYGDLDHNATGTWACMAVDARDGLLYRPMESAIGYGGTRYAPLNPLIMAGFMRTGLAAVTSGYLLGLCASVLLLGGLFALMRQLKIRTGVAIAMTLFTLCAVCFRSTMLGIKGDLLPAALNLWGLAAVVWASGQQKKPRGSLATGFASILFALAIAAKLTSIFGIASAALWLILQKRVRQTLLLLTGWGISVVAIILLTEWASDGRALTILRLCASGGGGIRQFIKAPLNLYKEGFKPDTIVLAFWMLAVAALGITRQIKSLPAILLVITTLGTTAIFGSPGTHVNHMIDLTAAAVLVLAFVIMREPKLRLAIAVAMILIVNVTAISRWREIGRIRHNNVRGEMLSALKEVDTSRINGPILSETPLLPILHGEQPYMLDSFMFRAVRKSRPTITNRLWDDLARQHFRAVILRNPPEYPGYSDSTNGDFGIGFIPTLLRTYSPAGKFGDFYVFLPKESISNP